MRSQALDCVVVPEIGKYHIIAELAHGGMGVVHLAVARGPAGFNKLLAVKELKPELAREDSYVAMFLEEARLAARLQHKNIVQTNEVASEGGRHFMVMEFLDGRSLNRITRKLADKGRFPLGAHLRVIAEMLVGLHYAHELKDFDGQSIDVVHRDISPLNVFVTFDGQVKVIDFGIAKTVDSSVETKTGTLKGRVAYMAPEQAWGSKVDRRADVYAAGVMLWEAAAGRRLWPGMSEVEILARTLRDGAPPLRDVVRGAPQDLDAICARATERNPDRRYSSAQEMLDDLEKHLARRSDALSMREVGALVSEVFAEERHRMREVIEVTLARLRSGPGSGIQSTVMPAFDIALSGTPSNRGPLEEPSYASAQITMHPTGTRIPMSRSMPLTLPFASPFVVPAPTQPPVHGGDPAAGQGSSGRRAKRLVLAGVVASGLAAAAVFVLRPERRVPAAAPPPGEVALPVSPPKVHAGPAPGGAEAPRLVDVVVRVSPPAAQITIDGVPVATNPFHARFPRDGLVHHVMAAADGYDSKLEEVSFFGDVSIDVSLDRHTPTRPSVNYAPPRAAAAAAGQATPAASRSSKHASETSASPPETTPTSLGPTPAAASHEVNPAGGRAPLRPIMTSNPYGGQ